MSYIPYLTLPSSIFNNAPISILLPIILGTGSGFVSQPGGNRPKTISDEPAKDRGTFKPIEERYVALKQPPLRPPPWVFAPVWTTLYGIMGYAAHRAWTTGMSSVSPRVLEDTRRGATLYTIQLGLNLLFMPLFFGLGRPIEALVDSVSLFGAVAYTTYVWSKVDDIASYCMVPYLIWCGFATYLTAATGYLNGWDTRDKITETTDKLKKSK